jgi:hypothetical protein
VIETVTTLSCTYHLVVALGHDNTDPKTNRRTRDIQPPVISEQRKSFKATHKEVQNIKYGHHQQGGLESTGNMMVSIPYI